MKPFSGILFAVPITIRSRMLGALTEKLQGAFARLRKNHQITEKNIGDAVREVRMALLDADVNYTVAKHLIQRIKEKALGTDVIRSVKASEQFIKIVHDELVVMMGGEEKPLSLVGSPPVLMVCGLQGSGKTTHCVKLARYLQKQKKCKKPLLIACDLQRPAAIEQLHTLGKQADIAVFSQKGETKPLRVAQAGLAFAKTSLHDLVIVDTAGRLHIDEELMEQLQSLKNFLQPSEILFVANAATGQDAVNSAAAFNQKIAITGSILTMLDGNTRGGAAISIREVTGQPLKFEGIGEGIDEIQLFNPQSMADRILGMGDTINLVRKAQEHIDEEQAKDLETKLRKATFSYDDYLKQLQTVKRMGSLKGLLSMLPGMGQALSSMPFDEKEFFKTEAIIQSMTPKERGCQIDLSVPRRKRIAQGSGTTIHEVNKLVKSFEKGKQFFKKMPNAKQFEKIMGGSLWR